MPQPPPSQPPGLSDCSDLLSSFGAGVLAAHIGAYWRDRGYLVHAERYELPGGGGGWGVRSDLYNGLPRQRAPSRKET